MTFPGAGNVDQTEAAVEIFNGEGPAPFLIVCEHASNFIPDGYARLGLDGAGQAAHVAWDPGALKVPFFHNNDDYDEAIFYHAGDFFSRDNIDAGMLTFHPSGFTHGPHPKALGNMLVQKKAATDEYAVMIDARDPLEPAAMPEGVELEHYAMSWASKEEAR